jgi:hypothetical protein
MLLGTRAYKAREAAFSALARTILHWRRPFRAPLADLVN